MYDLEGRTLIFSKDIISFCKNIIICPISRSLVDQAVRSAGSDGANYIEDNEALSIRNFLHRAKVSRKEAGEHIFWLENIKELTPEKSRRIDELNGEATQIKKILSAIIEKSKI